MREQRQNHAQRQDSRQYAEPMHDHRGGDQRTDPDQLHARIETLQKASGHRHIFGESACPVASTNPRAVFSTKPFRRRRPAAGGRRASSQFSSSASATINPTPTIAETR